MRNIQRIWLFFIIRGCVTDVLHFENVLRACIWDRSFILGQRVSDMEFGKYKLGYNKQQQLFTLNNFFLLCSFNELDFCYDPIIYTPIIISNTQVFNPIFFAIEVKNVTYLHFIELSPTFSCVCVCLPFPRTLS